MKDLIKYLFLFMALSTFFFACYDDKGNYDYLTSEEVGDIKIDTIGVENRYILLTTLNIGDRVTLDLNVTYIYPENLKYYWIAYPYPYGAVQQGNAMVYPPADTLGKEKKLDWTVNLTPGWWTYNFVVEDTVRGLKSSYRFQYGTIAQPGARSGVYILSEYDGQTDIDLYTSSLCLIFGGDSFTPHYYSSLQGTMLPGKPLFIGFGQDYYYVFTEENGYRLNTSGLTLMDDFSGMFYDVPSYRPQAVRYINSGEFLINNGKLHVLYTNRANDRKFSAPIAGNYQAGNYLSQMTRTSYSPVADAINADQIIFDEQNLAFRPYFSAATSLSQFKSTLPDAFVNANHFPAKPTAIFSSNGGQTYSILQHGGKPYLYITNFYNVVDDGDLSGNGINSIIDLSGCADIGQAKYFCSSTAGSAFFYATDKTAYSFTPSSGQTDAVTIYECETNEEITCLQQMISGGFPTQGAVFWVAVWNNVTQEGKLVEYEIDPYSGTPRSQWGPMFGGITQNPRIFTGFGKIKSMTIKS
ncbi:MAG: hypothetical protein LBR10_09450 [Prevotellaceae bacterium]|jgi:hypothetical protein|nr:hypothetical protein [Prevotellaceae bacterium]